MLRRKQLLFKICFILDCPTLIYFPYVQVSYSLRRLAAFQTQNLYIGPLGEENSSHTKVPDLNLLFPGAEAKPDPIKGGLRLTSFFTYNCLTVSLSKTCNPEKIYFQASKKETFQKLNSYSRVKSAPSLLVDGSGCKLSLGTKTA